MIPEYPYFVVNLGEDKVGVKYWTEWIAKAAAFDDLRTWRKYFQAFNGPINVKVSVWHSPTIHGTILHVASNDESIFREIPE